MSLNRPYPVITCSEYQDILSELDLSEQQKKKICEVFDILMKKPSHFANVCESIRKSNEPLPDIYYYHNGKIDGLNVAYHFFSGALHCKDELEPDLLNDEYEESSRDLPEFPDGIENNELFEFPDAK